jgi:hypothetical protein
MLKKPEFINLFIKKQVTFSDEILIIIGKYIISAIVKKEKVIVSKPIKEKMIEIQMYNDIKPPVSTESEFLDIIDRLKTENIRTSRNRYKNNVNTSEGENKTKMVQAFLNFKRKVNKNGKNNE